MKIVLFIFLMFFSFYNICKAGTDDLIKGAGYRSCIEYTDNISSRDLYFIWIQGYLSGMNIGAHFAKLKTLNLSALSLNEQQAFIENYCLENRDKYIKQAADALFVRLSKIQ